MWLMYVGIVGVHSKAFSVFIDSLIIRGDLSQHTIRCLHLFQCYTEAKSTEMPEIIDSIFKGGDISLHDIWLYPLNFLSIISFLSKCNINRKALRFNNCRVIEGDLINELKKFVIDNADKLSTLQYINLCNNFSHSSPWVVFCVVIKHCSVTNLTLRGSFSPSGIEQYADDLEDSLQQNVTLLSLTLCNFEIKELEIIKSVIMKTKCSVKKIAISAIKK